ncbi:hypothetical protein GF352_02185 [archaeon]|nr:hypothetical protein [archaeon]
MILELLAFLFGATLLIYFSPRIVRSSAKLAKALELDPIIIGLIIVGIGTSIPEISNAIISSVTGHGEINIGNSIGSGISQISLMFGLAILITGRVKGEKEKILFLGGCAILASILGASMMQKGYLSRIDGLLLLLSYLIIIYFIRVAVRKDYFKVELEENVYKTKIKTYAFRTAYSLVGIIIGALISVYMLVELSRLAGVPEFALSFFLMSINTSIPELVICISALREKEYGIAVGDIFGSNIADITLSMGSGALILPNIIGSAAPLWSGLYLVLITILITMLFSRKEELNRKHSILMIILYFLSYPIALI